MTERMAARGRAMDVDGREIEQERPGGGVERDGAERDGMVDAAGAGAGDEARRGSPARPNLREDRSSVRRLQIRAPSRDGWTKQKRQRFLEVLAATCNVSRSAKVAGGSAHGARRLRERDPEFERLWLKALQTGRDRLEEELLARALGTSEATAASGQWGNNPAEAELDLDAPAPEGAFDVDLAMQLMRMQRTAPAHQENSQRRGATRGEMDASLLKRLLDLGTALRAAPDAAEREAEDARVLAHAVATDTLFVEDGREPEAFGPAGGAA